MVDLKSNLKKDKKINMAQSAEAAECTDCLSAEG